MSTAVNSTSSSSSSQRRQLEQQRAQQAQQAQQVQQGLAGQGADGQATAEAEAKRGRVSGDVQAGSRQRAQAAEQQLRQQTEAAQAPGSKAAPRRGIAAAQAAGQGADPKTQPVMVLAPQYGDGQHDEIVKNSYERVKATSEKNGFKVIDAPNMTGEELKQKVAAELPKGHTGPLVAWTGGHGSVAEDKGEGKTEHELIASDADGKSREVRTGEDILRPIFDGAKEKGGHDPSMTAFVGSCRSGEAANDLAETFSKDEQKSLAVVTSSGRDQLSNGEGMMGVESATLAFTDMMASDSKTREKADANGDGAVSADEFANHLNTEGGGLAVAREKDLDGDQRPDEIQLDSQKLEVAGQGDNPLLPKDTGKPGWDESAGTMADPNRPTTKAQATEQAKEMQKYLAGIYGQTPKIVDNPQTAGGVDFTYDATGRTSDQGGASVRENDDGSKRITAGSKAEGYQYEENVAPGGKTGSYSVTDGEGRPLESGTKTYDAQGRPLTQDRQFPQPTEVKESKASWQYDDATKPYMTDTTTFDNGFSTTTRSFNDPAAQGPWFDNDVASITEHKDDQGQVFERTTQLNRPDTEEGKPYTMSKTEMMFDPQTGKPGLIKQESSSAKVGTTWTDGDGNPVPEAVIRQNWPFLLERN